MLQEWLSVFQASQGRGLLGGGTGERQPHVRMAKIGRNQDLRNRGFANARVG